MESLQSMPQQNENNYDCATDLQQGPRINNIIQNKTLLKVSFSFKERSCPGYANVDNSLKIKIGYFFFNMRAKPIQRLTNFLIKLFCKALISRVKLTYFIKFYLNAHSITCSNCRLRANLKERMGVD